MKKRILATVLTAFAGSLAMAYPDGFVYRGRVSRVRPKIAEVGSVTNIALTVSLYRDRGASTPLWSGQTNVTLSADGRYQVWVSDAMRIRGPQGGTETLVKALTEGHASALGLRFGTDGDEQRPRQSFSTMPLARYARNTLNIDDGGTVTGRATTDYLVVQTNGFGRAGDLSLGRTVVSNGVETTAMRSLTLLVDSWETTGTGGIVMRQSNNRNRRVFSDAPVRQLDFGCDCTKWPTKGYVLVRADAASAGDGRPCFVSKRGGVLSISCGRPVPCATFFVNPGEEFALPFDIPEDKNAARRPEPPTAPEGMIGIGFYGLTEEEEEEWKEGQRDLAYYQTAGRVNHCIVSFLEYGDARKDSDK